MKEFIQRFLTPTNTFWSRMRWFWLAVFAICVTIGDFSEILLGFGDQIPEQVINWAKYGRVAGATGAFLAQLTVKNTAPLEFQKKIDEAKNIQP